MFYTIRSLSRLEEYVADVQEKADRLLEDFDAKREEGQLAYFMEWDGVSLMATEIRRREARGLLEEVEAMLENHEWLEKRTREMGGSQEEAILLALELRCRDRAMDMHLDVASRSTSVAANRRGQSLRGREARLLRAHLQGAERRTKSERGVGRR